MIKPIASGIPETLEQFQLALDAAWAAGKVLGAAQPSPTVQEPVAWLDLSKMSDKGMVYATGFKVSDKQSALCLCTPPAPTVQEILSAFPLFDDDGLDEEEHHCEWALQQDRKRLHAMLQATPPAAPKKGQP